MGKKKEKKKGSLPVACLKGFYPTHFLTAGRKGNWQALLWQVDAAWLPWLSVLLLPSPGCLPDCLCLFWRGWEYRKLGEVWDWELPFTFTCLLKKKNITKFIKNSKRKKKKIWQKKSWLFLRCLRLFYDFKEQYAHLPAV